MKISINNVIYEADNSAVKYIGPDVELFHGTGEKINGELRPGGYDEVLWFSNNTTISQSYIKCGLYTNTTSRLLIRPPKEKNQRTTDLQKQLGIVFDTKYDANGLQTSYTIISPKEFIDIDANSFKIWKEEIAPLTTKERELEQSLSKHPLISGDLEEITEEQYAELEKDFDEKEKELLIFQEKVKIARDRYNKIDPDRLKMQYVDNKLAEYGYNADDYDPHYGGTYKLNIDEDGNILKADYKQSGKLYIARPKRDLKFYDISTGDPDETNLQYHQLKLFRKLEESGYDGVIIDDFAQNDHMGNVSHTSYGVFKHAINDLDFEVIDACHPNQIGKMSDEYAKHKGLLESNQDTNIWYHGSPAGFDKFDPSRLNPNIPLNYGPGFYLTRDINEAIGYAEGGYIMEFTIKPNSKISSESDKTNIKLITYVLKNTPDEILEIVLSNWSENPREAINLLKSSIIDSENLGSEIISIHNEIFVGYEAEFMKIIGNAINAVIFTSNRDSLMTSQYLPEILVVYNLDILEPKSKIAVSEYKKEA